jgi:hypothetical protein
MFITDRSGQTFSLPLSTFKIWAIILNLDARTNAIECNSIQIVQLHTPGRFDPINLKNN